MSFQFQRVGVVLLPNIFGGHVGLKRTENDLRTIDYDVEVVDIYSGQDDEKPPRWWFYVIPPFALIGGGIRGLNRVAESFEDAQALSMVNKAVWALKRRGCTKIVLLGYGMGGIFALKYVAYCRPSPEVAGVIAYYPHLRFHPGSQKQPPDLTKIPPTVRVQLFYGSADRDTFGSAEVACDLARQLPNVETLNICGQDKRPPQHGFAETYIQGDKVNPRYAPDAASQCWRVALTNIALWTTSESTVVM